MAKPIPFPFVLDELEGLDYRTRRMFGATAVYIGEKLMFCLWERSEYPEDSGIWIGTSREHHESLRRDFPFMHDIGIFGGGPTGWQVLPSNRPDFEESAYRLCALIRRGDPRIGKIPARKSKKGTQAPRSRRVSDEKKLPHPGRAGTAKKKPARRKR